MLGVGRGSPAVAKKLAGFDYRTLAWGWGASGCAWLIMGTSLWALLRGLDFAVNFSQAWHLYTAIVAMAVVVGFASMIPGGLVAREAVFTGLLAPLLRCPPETALIVAAALRLVWLLAELLISIILYFGGWLVGGANERGAST